MQTPNDRAGRITATLTRQFDPARLSVIDESAKHAGHAGAQPGGQTHFHVTLITSRFVGQSRVQRSRSVNDALKNEFATGLHALSLTLRTPEEDPG